MKKEITINRIIALTMTIIFIFGMGAGVLNTSESECQHEHSGSCGYIENSPCTHSHNDDCKYSIALPCVHVCNDECGYTEGIPEVPCECNDDDDEYIACSYIPATQGTPCTHNHDSNCGYIEAVDCDHTHDANCGYNEIAPCMAIIGSSKSGIKYATADNPHTGFFEISGITMTSSLSIAVTVTGMDNLKVGVPLTVDSAYVSYTISDSIYDATITETDFTVSGLPAGLTAGTATRHNDTEVRIQITGTPIAANSSTATLTYASSIPMENIDGAIENITPTGTLSASAVAKGDGAAVSGPPEHSLNSALTITVTAVTSTDTDKNPNVQYALSTNANALASELSWDSIRSRTGLIPNTTYYAYARTQESANYNAGAMQVSVGITTNKPSLLGYVMITGDAAFGETLTAVITELTSAPSTVGGIAWDLGTISYQWNRSGAPIVGATGSTYTLIGADVGHTITVTVTTDNTIESRTSDPTATVTCTHSFPSVWSDNIAATCTAAGEEFRKCVYCDYEETRSVSALGHNYVATYTQTLAPTCTAVGKESRKCSRCEDRIDERDVAALGHNFITYTGNTATCTEPGTETATCSRTGCTATDTRATSALGHSFTTYTGNTATCTEPGTETATCSRTGCTETNTRATVALGHDMPTAWTVRTPATDTVAGVEFRKCNRCEYEETREIAVDPIIPGEPGWNPPDVPKTILDQPGTYTGSGNAVTRIDGLPENFVQLKLDGVIVNPSNYTVTAGSTIITKLEAFIKTLPVGTHVFRAEFTTGYAEFSLTISATNENNTSGNNSNNQSGLPKTGVDSNLMLLISLLILSAMGAIITATMIKRIKSKKTR